MGIPVGDNSLIQALVLTTLFCCHFSVWRFVVFNSRAPARALACVASTRGVNMSYRREWVGDAPPRGGDDSRADFSAWERKVLLLTDQLCTRLTLTLHVVAMPFLFGPWAARPVTSSNPRQIKPVSRLLAADPTQPPQR